MELNTLQKVGFAQMKKGDNVFLTGKAGTGKSFLLNYFIDYAKSRKKKVLITAPTGIAAITLGGSTLHRTFQIPLDLKGIYEGPKDENKVVKEADILIIDEISMVRKDVFEYVMKSVKSNNKKIQIIVTGDFFQLPPILRSDEEKDYYKHLYGDYKIYPFQSHFWTEFGFTTVELKEVVRQSDRELIENLNLARVGDRKCVDYFNNFYGKKSIKDEISICSTNKQAFEINRGKISSLKGSVKKYEAEIEGDVTSSDKPTEDTLTLKAGARVMMLINDPNQQFSNGSLGVVKKLRAGGLDVKLDKGGIVTVEKNTWEVKKYFVTEKKDKKTGKIKKEFELRKVGKFTQLPVKPSFAITIHKSQGQTFEKVCVHPYSWSPGMLYVALSRCQSEKYLRIGEKIKDEFLLVDDEVLNFYYPSYSEKRENKIDKTDRIEKSSTKKARETRGRKRKYNGMETSLIRIPSVYKDFIESLSKSLSVGDIEKSKKELEKFCNKIKKGEI